MLTHPRLSARRYCSTPTRPPSSPQRRPPFCCLFEEGLPHFSLGLVAQTAGHSGWDMREAEVHSLMLYCPLVPWLVSRSGRDPQLQLSFLGLSTFGVRLELQQGPLTVHVAMPLSQWGSLQQRRGEEEQSFPFWSPRCSRGLWEDGFPRLG